MFTLDPYLGDKSNPVPYKKRDYCKVMLVLGGGVVHYADKVIEVKKQALTFSNPLIPYKWEQLENSQLQITTISYLCVRDRKYKAIKLSRLSVIHIFPDKFELIIAFTIEIKE